MAKGHWLKEVSKLPRGRPKIHQKEMETLSGYVPKELAQAVKEIAKANQVSIGTVITTLLTEGLREVDNGNCTKIL